MKQNIINRVLLALFLFAFFSCEKEEKVVDPRDQLVGTYESLITEHDGYWGFLRQGNGVTLIRKNADPSIIDIVQGGEVFCQLEIEAAPGGFLLHVVPGPVTWSGSSEDYSIVGQLDGFYDRDGTYVLIDNNDPSFYDVKENHFWLYYVILYKDDTPSRFVVLDGIKM